MKSTAVSGCTCSPRRRKAGTRASTQDKTASCRIRAKQKEGGGGWGAVPCQPGRACSTTAAATTFASNKDVISNALAACLEGATAQNSGSARGRVQVNGGGADTRENAARRRTRDRCTTIADSSYRLSATTPLGNARKLHRRAPRLGRLCGLVRLEAAWNVWILVLFSKGQ